MDLPFLPMLLERTLLPIRDEGWIYQVKWDGVRNLCLIEEGRVRHWSRRLRERTTLYPELTALAQSVPGRTVLDGEIVVLEQGKPQFHRVLERDLGNRADPAKLRSSPATFMVFDLLEWEGRELYQRPLSERLALLERVLPPGPAWQPVQSFPGPAGPDLFAAVVAQGLEGVVAKRLTSLYLPGERSRDWLKLKRRERQIAVVCGYTATAGRPGGLLLGAYRSGRLIYIGRAGSGLTAAQLNLIKTSLPPAAIPFEQRPTLRDRFSGTPDQVVWTEPILTVEVEYTEWTEEGRLRDPVVVGFPGLAPTAAQVD